MTDTPLITRITRRLAEQGLSPSRASLQAGLDRSFLRKFIQDQRAGSTRQLRPATMRRLAIVLGCNANWLMTGHGQADDPEPQKAPAADILTGVFVPGRAGAKRDGSGGFNARFNIGHDARGTAAPDIPVAPINWPQDMPVQAAFPTIEHGDGGQENFLLHLPGAGVAPVDYVRRPPGLIRARDAYVVYVQGDGMAPRYRAGEMVCVSPSRPARIGDDVLVVLTPHPVDASPCIACIGELVGRNAQAAGADPSGTITLRQHGTNAEFPLADADILTLHRLYTMGELMGM